LVNNPEILEATSSATYQDKGATAFDNIEGDITSRIDKEEQVDLSMPGIYYVHYNVTDNSGIPAATTTRKVIVKADFTPPVITIAGGNTVDHEVNTPFIVPSVTITDNPGNQILTNYTIDNQVDINILGTYTVTYDSNGCLW
jgi:hypothetical protein